MISGKEWLEDQDFITHPKEKLLEPRKCNKFICSVKRWRRELKNVARPLIMSSEDMKSIVKNFPICKALLNITTKHYEKNLSYR